MHQFDKQRFPEGSPWLTPFCFSSMLTSGQGSTTHVFNTNEVRKQRCRKGCPCLRFGCRTHPRNVGSFQTQFGTHKFTRLSSRGCSKTGHVRPPTGIKLLSVSGQVWKANRFKQQSRLTSRCAPTAIRNFSGKGGGPWQTRKRTSN